MDAKLALHLAAPRARRDAGRDRRRRVPLADHAEVVTEGRGDPISILMKQDEARLQELVPIRHGRMSATAFTFYRGGAAIMAADLAKGPLLDLDVQLCGDAHLANFGVFRAADRAMVFDLNDFDETLPGPFDWDVKRLAASVAIAARNNGIKPKKARQAVRHGMWRYREMMAKSSLKSPIDLHFLTLDVDDILEIGESRLTDKGVKRVEKALKKARSKDSLRAQRKLTDIVNGRRVIVPDPPKVMRVDELLGPARLPDLQRFFAAYLESLPNHRRAVLERYSAVDVAHKIVGVGSVGTRCLIVLLESSGGEPLFLQFKEAVESVLEPYLGASKYELHGERVVKGQRVLQASGDVFLGWARLEHSDGRGADFYFRQLWDGKGSADVDRMNADHLWRYAGGCGAALALAHARTGDSAMISGYVGDDEKDDEFDRALARFADRYADLNEEDHAAHLAAIASGRVEARAGV